MADRHRDRLFPADDNYARESRSAPQQPSAPDDPLAELARLIGQADPFSTYGRDQRSAQPSAHPHEEHHAEEPAGYEEEQPARPSWLQNLASARQTREQTYDQQTHDQQGYDQQAYGHQEPSFSPQPLSYGQDEQQHVQHDHLYADPRSHDPYRTDDQPAAEPRFEMTPRFDSAPRYERKNLSAPQAPQESEWGQQPLPDSARYDNVLYGQPDHDPNHGTPFSVQGDYGDGYHDQAYDEEEAQPRARRGGTMTVVVVLLLAVVGTAGAFAYRTLVGSPRSGEPPIIKADAGPNKIIPPGQGTDNAGKQIYDRVGDKNAERVVSREEQPVDVNARTSPRVVFPPLTQNNNPPTVASASPTVRPTGAGIGNGTLGGEEPRKIRTLSIRPGEQDAPSAAPAPQARGAAQPAPQRVATPATTASTPASNAPVSLAPQAQPPQAAAPDTKRMASLSQSAGAAGSYVQVSSQKNEADAQASFRALQAKYSGILGSRSATVRRADLGPKGVFYRAMVGPFGTTEEATQFCSSLKSAGGQCVVQRN